MRWRAVDWTIKVSGCLLGTLAVLGFAIGAFGAGTEETLSDGVYETAVMMDLSAETTWIRHGLTLPWPRSNGEGDSGWTAVGRLRWEHGGERAFQWNGEMEVQRGPLAAAVLWRRPLRGSADPFKLVGPSADGEASKAVVARWSSSSGSVFLQHGDDVPLGRERGSLATLRLEAGDAGPSFGYVAYGTARRQHHFVVLDGEAAPGERPLTWGVAWMAGVDAVDAGGPGGVAHERVQDGAAFLRGEWRRGVHSGWFRLHGTGTRFRSLAATNYPFSRGRFGWEGRWQRRLSTGVLWSVYGTGLYGLEESSYKTRYDAEARLSAMHRDAWGWALTGDGRLRGGKAERLGLEGLLTDPTRQFEWTTRIIYEAGGIAGWRHRLQWERGEWRLRMLVDTAFAAWRGEVRRQGEDGWSWTVVHKAPFFSRDDLPRGWTHVELRREVPGLGELWLRYMEPDLGRIDVGWRRSPTASAGLRIPF